MLSMDFVDPQHEAPGDLRHLAIWGTGHLDLHLKAEGHLDKHFQAAVRKLVRHLAA